MAAPSCSPHRIKFPPVPFNLFNACVAQSLTPKQWKAIPKAVQAIQDEWDKLRALPGGAWDESTPRDLNALLREAAAQGRTLHWGHVFDICVEKRNLGYLTCHRCNYLGLL